METDPIDAAATGRRFLDGLAAAAGLDRELLDRPGTTVLGRADRAGSGALACYRAGSHLVVWGDPAVVDRVAALAGPATTDREELAARLDAAGFDLHASLRNHLLAGRPTPPGSLAGGYGHEWLDPRAASTVDRVRDFAGRCPPAEVEAAALDELDDFDEAAINVVTAGPAPDPTVNPTAASETTPSGPTSGGAGRDHRPSIVAYASASPWEWDPALADVGVLVHADHRRRGLARFVVAATTARLLADGRIPLYRHEIANSGSAATAASIGFRPVAALDYFVLRP